MNIDRLKIILSQTTYSEVAGPETPGNNAILQLFRPLPKGSGILVDCFLLKVRVHPGRAQEFAAELVKILEYYPQPRSLIAGPSYLQVGQALKGKVKSPDLEGALRLFALGKVLGFWKIHTPAELASNDEQAQEMAKNGHITITGFDPKRYKPEGEE